MAGQYGIDLAVHIVASHFGDLVAKVCSCLLRRGTLSFAEIVRYAELPKSTEDRGPPPTSSGRPKSSDRSAERGHLRQTVKNCLLVLIQHNCVQAFSVPKPTGLPGETKSETQYMALFDFILHRLRFPKFIAIVRHDLGPECEDLLSVLLQNGRLTFEQLLGRALKNTKGSSSVSKELRANFNRLVHGCYVECCPRPEPFIDTSSEEAQLPRNRRAKSREEIFSLEKQAMIAAALSDAERFSGISDDGTQMTDAKPTDHLGVSAGAKRKYEANEADRDDQAANKDNEVLWRVNFEKFVYCLKKKICAANVRSRLGLEPGALLEAMMESSDQQTDSNSVTAPIDKILECVRAKPGGIKMTLEAIRANLDQLRCRSSTSDTGLLYTIDLKEIIETCQNDEVEFHVSSKYGKEAYRIFRYLVKTSHPVETDRVSDVTFVEKKVSQGILYKLWMDEYLEMTKVICPHADKQKQQFVWRINRTSLWRHFLNDMYHAALNLSLKISHYVELEPEVIDDSQKYAQTKRTWYILEASLLKLDDALMLFHNF